MAHDPVLHELAELTRRLSTAIRQALALPTARPHWALCQRQFAQRTGQPEAAVFAEAAAQAVTCGHLALGTGHHLTTAAGHWLLDQAEPLLQPVLRLCLADPDAPDARTVIADFSDRIAEQVRAMARTAAAVSDAEPGWTPTVLCERLLSCSDSRSRRLRGVYYTPPRIARYIVRRVDEALRAEFQLADGLADRAAWHDVLGDADAADSDRPGCPAAPFVRVFDPAMGTGVFLLEVFDAIRRAFVARNRAQRGPSGGQADDWDDFVVDLVLPRICGQELMLPAVVLAQLLMTSRLGASGFRFARPGKLQLHLGNTLGPPAGQAQRLAAEDRPYTVVLGNPPFSGISTNDEPWIRQLLRGRDPDARAVADYFRVDGRPLAERKHWLDDDYVKFLRLAHWLIEFATAGVVGLVTNHGFLDNITFRGMRQQLQRTFPRISLLDLHGNTRTGQRPPGGGDDQSVFAIEQGVAISLWRRPPHRHLAARIEHGELWGTCAEKLAALEGGRALPITRLEPHAPYYFFVPHDRTGESEYARGVPLPEAMPVNSTAAVTARDSFVVAFSEAELREKMSLLVDERIGDDELRQRFFTSSRSTRYPPGDTRGWKLPAARQRLRDDPDWPRFIRDCLYRPFDRRKIFWAPWMIDWPRPAVMAHLAAGDNRAIVARRQIPASHPCNYFWITDTIALDGLIRSDNRGSESVFPLFLWDDPPAFPRQAPARAMRSEPPERSPRVNFAPALLEQFGNRLQLEWTPHERGQQDNHFTALELFHYIYALLHAPSYQQRFAAWLRVDFPRVFVPAQRTLFRSLSGWGARLADLHLLRTHRPARATVQGAATAMHVSPGGPRRHGPYIQVHRELAVGPVPEEVWAFRAGAHQVCHKWLKDRRGRTLDRADLAHFCQILTAIQEAIACTREIERAISAGGGWENAFA